MVCKQTQLAMRAERGWGQRLILNVRPNITICSACFLLLIEGSIQFGAKTRTAAFVQNGNTPEQNGNTGTYFSCSYFNINEN